MQTVLPQYGIRLVEIPRIESGEQAISASRVRALLSQGIAPEELDALLPSVTTEFLRSEEGQKVINALQTK